MAPEPVLLTASTPIGDANMDSPASTEDEGDMTQVTHYVYECLHKANRKQRIALVSQLYTLISGLRFDDSLPSPSILQTPLSDPHPVPTAEISAAVSLQYLSQPPALAPRPAPSGPPPRRTRRKRRAYPGSDTLVPIELALSPQVSHTILQTSRDIFFQRLTTLDLTIRKDNKDVPVLFTHEEATDITNFFFVEVMGTNARLRLINLLDTYRDQKEDDLDIKLATRAETLSLNQATYLPIRRFYQTLARAGRHRVGTQSVFASFLATVDNVELYEQWEKLRGLAKAKDKTLISFLHSNGYKTSLGVDYRSCVNQFLTKSLDLPNSTMLTNICAAAQGLWELTQKFGKGVLVLLPPGTGNQLNRWGNQRMSKVYDLLEELVGMFQPVCEAAHQQLYLPMTQGLPLQTPIQRYGNLEDFIRGIAPPPESKELRKRLPKRRRVR